MHPGDTENHTMPTFEVLVPNQNHEAMSVLLRCVSSGLGAMAWCPGTWPAHA